jgi:hypothetical protein
MRSLKHLFRITIPKGLFLYVLFPSLSLWFLARPVHDAVLASGTAVFPILLAVLAAAGLNWLVYALIRRKRPSLLVFSFGLFCVLAVAVIMYDAVPGVDQLSSTLSYICAFLAMAALFLLSYWFVLRRTRPARTAALVLRIILALIFWGMVYQIYRDIESRIMTPDTWITIGFLVIFLLGFNIPRILPWYRRTRLRRRTTGLATGRITRIVGETALDGDDDLVTSFHAFIRYMVQDVPYEIKAGVSRHTLRRYGKESFIGRPVPVYYNPADPAEALAERITRCVLDQER